MSNVQAVLSRYRARKFEQENNQTARQVEQKLLSEFVGSVQRFGLAPTPEVALPHKGTIARDTTIVALNRGTFTIGEVVKEVLANKELKARFPKLRAETIRGVIYRSTLFERVPGVESTFRRADNKSTNLISPFLEKLATQVQGRIEELREIQDEDPTVVGTVSLDEVIKDLEAISSGSRTVPVVKPGKVSAAKPTPSSRAKAATMRVTNQGEPTIWYRIAKVMEFHNMVHFTAVEAVNLTRHYFPSIKEKSIRRLLPKCGKVFKLVGTDKYSCRWIVKAKRVESFKGVDCQDFTVPTKVAQHIRDVASGAVKPA